MIDDVWVAYSKHLIFGFEQWLIALYNQKHTETSCRKFDLSLVHRAVLSMWIIIMHGSPN